MTWLFLYRDLTVLIAPTCNNPRETLENQVIDKVICELRSADFTENRESNGTARNTELHGRKRLPISRAIFQAGTEGLRGVEVPLRGVIWATSGSRCSFLVPEVQELQMLISTGLEIILLLNRNQVSCQIKMLCRDRQQISAGG